MEILKYGAIQIAKTNAFQFSLSEYFNVPSAPKDGYMQVCFIEWLLFKEMKQIVYCTVSYHGWPV